MGPRLARSSVSTANPRTARKKNQKRALDAFAIAGHSVSDAPKIRQHRLGEADEEPRQRKRQRLEDDEEDGDEEGGHPQRKKAPKGRFDELDISEGSDSEGHEWRLGHVDEDDDSDIDSDEAFGESDEERFEGFTFRGSENNKKKGKKQVKKPRRAEEEDEDMEVDLDEGGNEDDEDSDDSFGEDGVDLATMLDNYSEDEEAGNSKRKGGESDEESFKDFDASDEEDAEEDSDKLEKLQDLISSLQPKEASAGKKPRPVDVHESSAPSDFGLTTSQKLKLEDLLPTVNDPALRKSLKLLRDDAKPSKRTGIPGKLEAPLPKRQQDKLDRAAANEKAKETLERWVDTVKHNRRAEHLQFPMKDTSEEQPQGRTRLMPTSDAPLNDLESTIQNILVESGLSAKKGKSEEEQLRAFEELETKKIPLEEIQARRAELRKARELLFREEVRAKRIKKIKSKAYRRVHRKERERLAEREREALVAEGIDVSENEREYNDRRRAEERMGAKHRESKWAKGVKAAGRAAWDEDARAGVSEMARRNEELRRRMEGKDVRDEDEEGSDVPSVDDSESDDSDDEDATATRRLQRQLARLDGSGDDRTSKIANLAFMKRAEAARKAQNDEDIERMRRELAGEDSPSEGEADNAVSAGRRKFGPTSKAAVQIAKPARNEFEEEDASDNGDEDEADDVEIITESKAPSKPSSAKKGSGLANDKKAHLTAAEPEPVDPEDNPWLSGNKKKGVSKYEPSDSLIWNDEPQERKKPKSKKSSKAKSDENGATLTTGTDGWTTVSYGNGVAESEEDDESAYQPFVLRNVELVEKGFAGDDVVADFEKEKKATIDEEDDKVIDNTLPGWGNWVGDDISKRQKKQNKGRFLTKQAGIKPEARKDAKLDRVIINEKRVKKNAKFLAGELPHGFESRQQYERTLRMPKGPEWTTKQTFQDATKPRVLLKQGIITPLEKPLI